VWTAFALLSGWAVSLVGGAVLLSRIELAGAGVACWLLVAWLRTFTNVGLFITAHDAMHGTVAPRWPRANDAIGAACLLLYAGLSYRALRTAHHAHHATPGVASDPDWSDDPRLVVWLWRFVAQYASWRALIAHGTYVTLLLLCGASVPVILAVQVLPAWMSVVQLFVFGTWLPHRPPREGTFVDAHRATSTSSPAWLSLLTCFHFGYHLEHHRAPHVPWPGLPRERRLRLAVERGSRVTAERVPASKSG
jgi:beta-carotene ketolase (CrtW type)